MVKWNEDLFFNFYGDMFNVEGKLLVLFCLYGLGGSEKIVLEGFNVMYVLLVIINMDIVELLLSE